MLAIALDVGGRPRHRNDQHRSIKKSLPRKSGSTFRRQRSIPVTLGLFAFENDKIKALRVSCRRHSTRKIKNAVKNIRRNRTRFKRTNHAPVCDNIGELHYADLKIT
jgi:hypothetical protein